MSRPLTVLIVDDEPGTVRVLAAVLSDAGHVIETASDGASALEMLAATDVDVVLLDYLMPRLDGCETLRAIRRSKRFADVPVVMMSGVPESMVRRNARAPFEAFLGKPFSLDMLLDVVKKLGKPPRSRRGDRRA